MTQKQILSSLVGILFYFLAALNSDSTVPNMHAFLFQKNGQASWAAAPNANL
jgi:hypothetical protein